MELAALQSGSLGTSNGAGSSMSTRLRGGPEMERINFLVKRDGESAARAWVERTLKMYREVISNPRSHASYKDYQPLFQESIHEFEAWLAARQ